MRSLIVTPGAFDDVRAAFRWYEEQRDGLGASFEDSLGRSLARVQENPAHFPVVGEAGLRRAVVDRFPYHVYFVADDRMARVIVVFHTARGPRALLNRLKQH